MERTDINLCFASDCRRQAESFAITAKIWYSFSRFQNLNSFM